MRRKTRVRPGGVEHLPLSPRISHVPKKVGQGVGTSMAIGSLSLSSGHRCRQTPGLRFSLSPTGQARVSNDSQASPRQPPRATARANGRTARATCRDSGEAVSQGLGDRRRHSTRERRQVAFDRPQFTLDHRPTNGRFLTGARNFTPSHGLMELAFAVTPCGELLRTQDKPTDTPTLRSRFDASVDETDAVSEDAFRAVEVSNRSINSHMVLTSRIVTAGSCLTRQRYDARRFTELIDNPRAWDDSCGVPSS